jgi:hypothetical protein
MKKCKWCDKEITENKRKDAIFCRRRCKGMYSRKMKNERLKNEKIL